MKILVTGDRNWTDKELIKKTLSEFPEHTFVIQGGCRGADNLASEVAKELGMTEITVLAKWDKYGKMAGPIRNGIMLDMNPDLVIAFHDDFDHSKGTRDCVYQAQLRGIKVRFIKHGLD